MSTLPGNPHAESAQRQYDYVGESWMSEEGITDATMISATIQASALATLAVAHELRTATLVNALLHDSLIGDAHYDDLIAETRTRLGLGGEGE